MKHIIIIFLFFSIFTLADEFDEKDEKIALFPMSKQEIRKYFPLIQPMLSENELKEKEKLEALAKAKKVEEKQKKQNTISKTFTKKDDLKKIEHEAEKINIEEDEFGFMDTSESEEKAPVNME